MSIKENRGGSAVRSAHGGEAQSKMFNQRKPCRSRDIWMTFPVEDGQAKSEEVLQAEKTSSGASQGRKKAKKESSGQGQPAQRSQATGQRSEGFTLRRDMMTRQMTDPDFSSLAVVGCSSDTQPIIIIKSNPEIKICFRKKCNLARVFTTRVADSVEAGSLLAGSRLHGEIQRGVVTCSIKSIIFLKNRFIRFIHFN